MLRPVGSWDIRGGHGTPRPGGRGATCSGRPATSRDSSLMRPSIHCRYAVDPSRPWLGVGPLQWAESTGALAGRLEAGLADEAGAPAAQLVPVPQDGGDGGDDDPLKQLKADIAKAKRQSLAGRNHEPPVSDKGRPVRPAAIGSNRRIGAEWPDVLRATARRRRVRARPAHACNRAGRRYCMSRDRKGRRNARALRRWVHLAVEPMGATCRGGARGEARPSGLANQLRAAHGERFGRQGAGHQGACRGRA